MSRDSVPAAQLRHPPCGHRFGLSSIGAEVRYCDATEQARLCHRAGRVGVERTGELRMREGRPETGNRFPHRIVQEHATARDAPVQLGGSVARLSFHPVGIVLPCLELRIHICRIDREHVDGDDGRQVFAESIVDRNLCIEGANGEHGIPASGWCGNGRKPLALLDRVVTPVTPPLVHRYRCVGASVQTTAHRQTARRPCASGTRRTPTFPSRSDRSPAIVDPIARSSTTTARRAIG
jgi:hypothetical protein